MSLGLYLQYPFVRRQPGFRNAATALHDPGLERRFFTNLLYEVELIADAYRNNTNHIEAISVGGGDLTLVDLDLFEAWYQQVQSLFMVKRSCEITMEIDPRHSHRELLQALLVIGVNRLSFRVETLSDRFLRLLGKKQALRRVHEAVYLAEALGLEEYSCDLFYGLPSQTGRNFMADLDQVVDLEPPHIRYRPFTIVPGTGLASRIAARRLPALDSELVATFGRAGREHLKEHGYEEYVDNMFARPDHECQYCRHRSDGGDFIGLGPAARSLVGGKRSTNTSDFHEYLDALEQGHRPIVKNR